MIQSHLVPSDQEWALINAVLYKVRAAAHYQLDEAGYDVPAYTLEWSWEDLLPDGDIRWKEQTPPVVIMSGIYFLHCYRKHGIKRLAGEMAQTFIHELCHLAARDDRHGPRWKAAMYLCGLSPSITHHTIHTMIGDILPKAWREMVPLGKEIWFFADGSLHKGRVRRWSVKNVTLTDRAGVYKIHWHDLESAIKTGEEILLLWVEDHKKEIVSDDPHPDPPHECIFCGDDAHVQLDENTWVCQNHANGRSPLPLKDNSPDDIPDWDIMPVKKFFKKRFHKLNLFYGGVPSILQYRKQHEMIPSTSPPPMSKIVHKRNILKDLRKMIF